MTDDIENAVEETIEEAVEEAVEDAVQEVITESAIESAVDAAEDAADSAEDAARAAEAAAAAATTAVVMDNGNSGITADEVEGIVRRIIDERFPPEPITEVVEDAVEEIVEAEESVDDMPPVDTPPQSKHWLDRKVIKR